MPVDEIPANVFDAAAAGDLDALWELDALVARHGLLDATLARARAAMDAGDTDARFLTGWLELDTGIAEAEVAELLEAACDAGHAMARAVRGDLLARLALGGERHDDVQPSDPRQENRRQGNSRPDDLHPDDFRSDDLVAGRDLMRAGADAGAPIGLVFLAHSHLDEYLRTHDAALLDTARAFLDEIAPPAPGEPAGEGALTAATARTWGRLGAVHLEAGDREAARACHERARHLGSPGALNDIGTTFDGDPSDDGYDREEAKRWYRRAAEEDGSTLGAYNLGTLLWEDSKETSDPILESEAEELLWVAVEDDNLDAMHNLGKLLTARDDPESQAEGDGLLQRAADEDHLGALFSLSDVLKQDASRRDEAEAILRRLVDDHDHLDALNDLGLLLWERGTDASVTEAEDLYRRSLEREPDDPVVLLNLGVLLRRRGEDDEDLCQESRRVTERAAELGDLRARYNLGNWYRDHDRLDEAAEHYRQAVDRGHVAAHCDLASILDDSDDPADLDEAERLFRWAASEHDHPLSLNNLGVLLLRRDGERSRDEAEALIERAAEAGNDMGVGSWGKVLYQRGEHDRAREWLRRGANEGSGRAAQLLELWDAGETEYLERWGPPITGAARRD